MHETAHKPVLLNEVLLYFREGPGAQCPAPLILDCTLGGGGHSEALLREGPSIRLVALDRDTGAVERSADRLRAYIGRALFLHANFGAAMKAVAEAQHRVGSELGVSREPLQFDFILADLGLSSDQLNDPSRGFSFLADGPLDMRMDANAPRTAADVLNNYEPKELKKVFLRGGLAARESALLASEIVRRRPLQRTGDFVRACEAVIPRFKKGEKRHHPATVPFQAVRIEVNSEFESIESLLHDVPELLAPGGRFAVISFQSLEDQLVTRAMREWSRVLHTPRGLPVREGAPAMGRLLTAHAVHPRVEEEKDNSRARSARLRVFERRRGSSDVAG